MKKSLWGRTVAREGKKSTGRHLSHGLQPCIVSLIITRQIKTENENSSFYFAQGYFFLPVLRNPHHWGFFFFFLRFVSKWEIWRCEKGRLPFITKKPDAGGAEIRKGELIRFHILSQLTRADNLLELYLYTTHYCRGFVGSISNACHCTRQLSINYKTLTNNTTIKIVALYTYKLPGQETFFDEL